MSGSGFICFDIEFSANWHLLEGKTVHQTCKCQSSQNCLSSIIRGSISYCFWISHFFTEFLEKHSKVKLPCFFRNWDDTWRRWLMTFWYLKREDTSLSSPRQMLESDKTQQGLSLSPEHYVYGKLSKARERRGKRKHIFCFNDMKMNHTFKNSAVPFWFLATVFW